MPRKSPATIYLCQSPRLSDQFHYADAVVRVKWIEATHEMNQATGLTTYEILDVLKKPARTPMAENSKHIQGKDAVRSKNLPAKTDEISATKSDRVDIATAADLTPGMQITLAPYRAGKRGDQFLLTGNGTNNVTWAAPLRLTDASYAYITNLPDPGTATVERLNYFMKFLEHPESLIASDAYNEFEAVRFKDISPLVDTMPRDKLRAWIADPETNRKRLGLYGLMLGLCGNEKDAALMESVTFQPGEDPQLGSEVIRWDDHGMISGYLMLKKESGLDRVDRLKLKPRYLLDADGEPVLSESGNKRPLPFIETYRAMQALRFMWDHGNDRIPRERLRRSMRLLLNRLELADLVIAELARWQDWSVQDRVMELYGAEEGNIPLIKRAIVRYLIVCSKSVPTGENAEVPQHVQDAKQNLDRLREEDPKTVADAERFFFYK